MLTVAAILIILTGIAHSVLGEKYILRRLFKRDNLPAIMGSDFYTKGTLRFTWHITSIAWWGIAWVLLVDPKPSSTFLSAVCVVCLISAVFAAYFTKGKHLSWIVFLIISCLTFIAI